MGQVDIIVTTPKTQSAVAAQEAEDAKAGRITEYFRIFRHNPPPVARGSRVYYVEDGAMTGFAEVARADTVDVQTCATSGREYGPGTMVVMSCKSWQWIAGNDGRLIRHKGFQGWRYAKFERSSVCVMGGWRDQRPFAEGPRS